MPVRTCKIRGTDATVIEHTCEICGNYAMFGFGVFLTKAYEAMDKGNINLAKEFLGKWYCKEHKHESNK